MKKNLKIIAVYFSAVIVALALNSCRLDDDDNPHNNSNTPAAVSNIVTAGTWRITSYNDSGVDKTGLYSGINFVFSGNNILTAIEGNSSYPGTWSVTDSNSNDDSVNDLDFNIMFSSPAKLTELNDDWDILEKSNNVIKLIDVSGGNGGTDYLTFTKN